MESYRNVKVVVQKSLSWLKWKRESKTMFHRTTVQIKESEKTTKMLKQSFDFIDFFGKLLGWRFSYEWTTNFRFWVSVSFLIFTWSQLFYSQFKYVANGEYRRVFEVFALYGISISCSLKFRCFFNYYKEMTALRSFSYKIIQLANSNAAGKLIERQIYNLRTYKLIAMVELASAVIYLYHPLKSLILNHEMVPLLPVEIMFIDQSEVSGFLMSNCIVTIMSFCAMFGSLFVDMNFYALILNCSFQIDLIEFDVKQLDELWANTAASTLSNRYLLLRNICQKCQDKNNYIVKMKEIFDETIYLYFTAVYISQIICLYEIEIENWIPGYGTAFGMFIEMLLHCLFGTQVTIINERLCYILTQSSWYTYDVPSQKKFLILLGSCMSSQDLWIGPLAPLSVITGIQILKSIYSYYTFLAEVV